VSRNAAAAAIEVRACPKCQAPAVTNVFTWTHTTWGTGTGQFTHEYRCQACGASFVVRPKSHVIGLFLAGAILSFSCIGLPMLYVAWRRWTVESRIPVVPGAPPPLLRFRGGPPLRSCGECAGTATAMKITRHTHNGIPTGTEYGYACAGCAREFTVESFLGQFISIVSGLLLAGGAALFVIEGTTPAWRWGGSAVCSLLALFLLVQAGRRLMNRLRNPVLPDLLAPIG
jgi:hypothetical protein